MPENDFLEKIVSAVKMLSECCPKQMLGIKDLESKHVYCSQYLLELMGATMDECVGKKVWLPLYGNDSNFEKIIEEEDREIIASRIPRTYLKINNFSIGLTPYFCRKSPIINPENKKVVGILTQGYEVGLMAFKKHFLKTDLSNQHIEKSEIHLSKRERQVIYFFMAHLSSQEIADVLHQIENKKVTKSTIDSLFNDQLYPKFDAYSRPDLYKKLQTLGFENKIPEELLKSTSLFLPGMDVY
ncbi:MAG: hypothetical protein ACD_79C00401G0001, partial [uncultured bacterium]